MYIQSHLHLVKGTNGSLGYVALCMVCMRVGLVASLASSITKHSMSCHAGPTNQAATSEQYGKFRAHIT